MSLVPELTAARREPITVDSLRRTAELESQLLTKGHLSIVVMGASGDLASKKTFPAIGALAEWGLLPTDTAVIGYSRSSVPTQDINEWIGAEACQGLNVQHVPGSYDSVHGLRDALAAVAEGAEVDNRLFYLALPPFLYATVARAIHENLRSDSGFNRFVVEKPFGKDSGSFEELHQALAFLQEEELYRIDHYLGKEMVQNLAVLRFGNSIFEPLWNRQYVRAIVISFKEPFGVEGRGGYFDKYGMLRDVLQNHLLQVLSLFAMEPPISLEANDIRDEKVKLLRSISAIKPEDVVLGQYKGYTEHDDVPDDSKTATFAACVLYIKNGRWRDVPFILKAGKALDERKAEVRLQFHRNPIRLFGDDITDNELVLRLQPDEAVYLKVHSKRPGLDMNLSQVELDLTFKERFEGATIPGAYERLLYDVLRGEQSQFVRDDELREAWRIFTPLLHYAEGKDAPHPVVYPRGIRSPSEADVLLERVGYRYRKAYTWDKPKGPAEGSSSSSGSSNGVAQPKQEL